MNETGTGERRGYADYLAPTMCNGFVIGYLDFIHGEGGSVVPDYPLTRHELLVLAQYWSKARIDVLWFYHAYGQTGSTEWRTLDYSMDRLNLMADRIGLEVIQETYDRTAEEIEKAAGPVVPIQEQLDQEGENPPDGEAGYFHE